MYIHKKHSVIAAHNMHAIMKNLFSIGVDFRREHQHFSILYKISGISKLALATDFCEM